MSNSPALPEAGPQRPSAAMLHGCLLLAGLATALLGPILPLLSFRWHMSDQQSGLLLLAQFCGATTGGLTVSHRLNRSLTLGLAASAIGFLAFSAAPSFPYACIALFVAGWGVGQLITASNITAGRRYAEHRGSALALLNFSFSLGAMLSPLLAAWLTPHFALRSLLKCFATCFTILLLRLMFELPLPAQHERTEASVATIKSSLTLRIYFYFAFLLFLYGGVETSLDGWLTTFALRYGDKSFALSEYTTLLFWLSLTAGRAASSAIMLRISERTLQRLGLVAAALCVAALAIAHGGLSIAVVASLLGLSLSPFFPSTFALLMADRPTASQAGIVMSASGLGAAALPWLMGVLSTHTGSLQVSLAVPLVAALALLVLSLLTFNRSSERRPSQSGTVPSQA